jgi:Fur family transcriptional regulator, peroxide stress response regulator
MKRRATTPKAVPEAPAWETLAGMLKEHRLRPTSQRLMILRYLAQEHAHYRPDEIWQEVNRGFPASSRATVYNTLHSLVDAGLVREVVAESGGHYYELNRGPHFHVVCVKCGSIQDVPAALVQGLEMPQIPGFRVQGVEVTYRGICNRGECRGIQAGSRERRHASGKLEVI